MAIDEHEKKGAVDTEISQRAVAFAQLWSKPFQNLPRYELDFSWPSITTLGLIYELVIRESGRTLPPEFLNGAAAYLGIAAASIWQVFPDDAGRVKLQLKGDAVILSKAIASDDGNSPKKLLGQIDITAAITQLSADPGFYFPASIVDGLTPFTKFRKLALEIFSATIPALEGSWKNEAEESKVQRLVSFDLSLAQSTANYMHRVFPGEQELDRQELYLAGVLSPPVGYNEPGPFARAAMSLYRNLSTTFPDEAARRQALATITTCVDPQLAIAALIVGIADGQATASQLSRLERIAFYAAPLSQQLKGTIELLRKTMLRPAIVDLCNKPIDDESDRLINGIIDTERRLGFFSNIPLNAKPILTIPKLLPALYTERFDVVERVLNEHRDKTEQHEWLSLLLARSQLMTKNFAGAMESLKFIREHFGARLEEKSLFSARFFGLLGEILIADGDHELAAGYFHDALERCPDSEQEALSDLVTSQGVALNQLGDTPAAQQCFVEALDINPKNRVALLLWEQPNLTTDEIAAALRLLPYSLDYLKQQIGTAIIS